MKITPAQITTWLLIGATILCVLYDHEIAAFWFGVFSWASWAFSD